MLFIVIEKEKKITIQRTNLIRQLLKLVNGIVSNILIIVHYLPFIINLQVIITGPNSIITKQLNFYRKVVQSNFNFFLLNLKSSKCVYFDFDFYPKLYHYHCECLVFVPMVNILISFDKRVPLYINNAIIDDFAVRLGSLLGFLFFFFLFFFFFYFFLLYYFFFI